MTTFPAVLPANPASAALPMPYAQAGAPRTPPLLPTDLKQAMTLAEVMSSGKLTPSHLKTPADCLAVILQAIRWQADPFAVAQCTSLVNGKLMYEGKLVSAIVNTSGRIKGRLEHSYAGEGDDREVTCTGWLHGDAAPVSVTVKLKDAKTNNAMWVKQTDQQLAYHSSRVWARRFCPELMLGIYSSEEMIEAPAEQRQGGEQQQLTPPADQHRATPTVELKVPGGGSVSFPKTPPGVEALLKYAAEADPGVIMLNLALLDTIADRMTQHADKVAEIRARAAKALTPADQWPGDEAAAESQRLDAESRRRAVIKDGAAPEEDADAEA
jgi:hypothetical protein